MNSRNHLKKLFKKTVSASQELCTTSLCSLHSENGYSRVHTSIYIYIAAPDWAYAVFLSAQVPPERTCAMFSSAQVAPEHTCAVFSKAQVAPERTCALISSAQVAAERTCAVFSSAQVAPERICAVFSSAQVAPERTCAVFSRENSSFLRLNHENRSHLGA